ncbi:MAG: alpha/beta hydrolase [Terriglobia bacterium]|jgi:pimeloyl-ACP methyl ester carboxylesterase
MNISSIVGALSAARFFAPLHLVSSLPAQHSAGSHLRPGICPLALAGGLLLVPLLSLASGVPRAKERFANLDGHRIYYRSFGSGKSAMIFLSGWGCDTSLWRNQVPALVPYSRVLLVDLPGHGRSDKPDIPYTLDLFARAVYAVLEHARVQKAAVVGHSMGGMVAYEFARRWPEKTIALIWVDGTFTIPVDVDQQITGLRKRAEDFRSPDYQEKVRKFIDQLYVPQTPTAVRDEVTRSILATPQHVLVGCLEGLADRRLYEPHPPLDLPAFAIFSSFWNPERFIDIFKKSLPRLQYQVLTGVGHYPMLEKPDLVNAALTRFVASIQPELRKH